MITIESTERKNSFEWCSTCGKQTNTKRIGFSRDGRSGFSIVLCDDCRKELKNMLCNESLDEITEKEVSNDLPEEVRFAKITDPDIEKAKKVRKEDPSRMYIDCWYFEVVEQYLSHFEGPEYDLAEILDENTVQNIISSDNELSLYISSRYIVPKAFNRVCEYIEAVLK